MKKWFVWPVLLAGALCACGAQPTGQSAVTLPMTTERPAVADLPADEAGPTPEPTPAAETTLTAADLTLEEKVGQLFIIRPDSLDLTLPQGQIDDAKADGVTELTDAMRDALQKYPVGGVCQFGKNIVDPEQITAFNAALAGVCVTGGPDAGSEGGGGRLELLQGSLLEPVAGRRFDLPLFKLRLHLLHLRLHLLRLTHHILHIHPARKSAFCHCSILQNVFI